jgi:prolipoprotein diacylglyceryltransferase
MSDHEHSSMDMTPKDMAKSAASKLFDLRILIGGLFTFYGVALVIYSFFTTPEELAKAAGININLWLGLAMLLLGVIFLLWARLSPVVHEAPSDDDAGAARPPMH